MSESKTPKKAFRYFDSPDGEDVFPKYGLLLKPMALISFGLGTTDVMLYSHPKGYMQVLARYAHFTWPVFVGTGAFVVGHNLAGTIRKKDDIINWFIGGAVAGNVVGVWRKSIMVGFVSSIGLGALAAGKKYCQLNGINLLMPDKLTAEFGGVRSAQFDWTLTKERPRNWTTGTES